MYINLGRKLSKAPIPPSRTPFPFYEQTNNTNCEPLVVYGVRSESLKIYVIN